MLLESGRGERDSELRELGEQEREATKCDEQRR